MQKETTVAFSGHRLIVPANQHSLFGWDIDDPDFHWNYMTGATTGFVDSVRKKLDMILSKLVKDGYDTFVCGMATGFDLMAGAAVCDMMDNGAAVSLIAAVPYPGQADRFSEEDRQAYQLILEHCRDIHTVCESYSKDCFHRRNDFLVENASALVCFYNGSPGGTHYTVRRALKQGLRIINLA